jgi:hypothetical protein
MASNLSPIKCDRSSRDAICIFDIQCLNGLMLGMSVGSFRRLFSSQIVFEYLGTDIDLRNAITDCGCYPIDNGPISEAVKSRLLVPVSDGDFTMTPPVF